MSRQPLRPRFYCVSEHWLTETNEALQAACDARGVEMILADPARHAVAPFDPPAPGDALYRAGTSLECMRLEQLLYTRGVSAFGGDPLFGCFNPHLLFERVGLRIPRTVHVVTTDRAALARAVEFLGGYPVVVKQPGGEGGVGIVRVDSAESLYSVMDYIGGAPLLMEYFPHSVAYRLVVIGDQVVDTEVRKAGAGDFRSNAAGNELLGSRTPPAAAVALALAASRAIGIAFGGADILENESGELVLSEFNSPCYFADQQASSGVDIAGQMIDWLLQSPDARRAR